MRLLSRNIVRPGFELPGALCDPNGKILVPAGVRLNKNHAELLRGRSRRGLYGGVNWPEECFETGADARTEGGNGKVGTRPQAANNRRDDETIGIDSLEIESRREYSLYDAYGGLLLPAGRPVTVRFLKVLRLRGTTQLHRRRPLTVGSFGRKKRRPTAIPAHLDIGPRLSVNNLFSEVEFGLVRHAEAVEILTDVYEDMETSARTHLSKIKELMSDFQRMMNRDSSLCALIVGLQTGLGSQLFEHSINVALLGMSMAMRLGMEPRSIMEFGISCLLNDMGMMKVPKSIWNAARRLTDEERRELIRHPEYTLDMIKQVPRLPDLARIIASQIHERCDGSGYPRGKQTIHPLARMAAVADVYAALTKPRPHRLGKRPHDAMLQILHSVEEFDSTSVRLVLKTVSAVPIGSLVRLSNGDKARVIRANPTKLTKPTVAILSNDGQPNGEEVDLAVEQNLQINLTL